MMRTREEQIAGIRELADWLEANPEIPVPHNLTGNSQYSYELTLGDEVAKVADNLLAAAARPVEPAGHRTAFDVAYNIVNQLADQWNVPVDVRQKTNDGSWEFAAALIAEFASVVRGIAEGGGEEPETRESLATLITDEQVDAAERAWNKAYWTESIPNKHDWMRAALEAALPLLGLQQTPTRYQISEAIRDALRAGDWVKPTITVGIASESAADAVLALLKGTNDGV